jgi:uracil-DNA glycosylase family 4
MNSVERWDELDEEIIRCRKCPRLVAYREEVARLRRRAYREQEYWGKPVPGFGDHQARLLIFGLAPGAHGSNRTGRMFTGDSSGEFLYAALHRAGFASQSTSESRNDSLELKDVFISATCRCAPPDNRPTPQEMLNCRPFILAELDLLPRLRGIVALGKIAFDNILATYRQKGYPLPSLEFRHARFYDLGYGLPWLLASYHPSRQNTQTGRLTVAMFDVIWEEAGKRLG